jgi:Domain of unknown function (DUF4124)
VLLVLVLQASAAAAQTIYTWVDRNGATHFTDDPSTAPRGVKVRTTEGAELSHISADRPAAAPDAGVMPTAPAASEPEVPSTAEQQWRRQFLDAHARVATLEDDVERDRLQVEDVNGLPINASFNCSWGGQQYGGRYVVPCGSNPEYQRLKERLATNRRALERAKTELDDLERRASYAGVPREWRR